MIARLRRQVLIVGLGPVGMTLAGLLADAGVQVLAIDKSTEVYPLPRAGHFDHEIMRVFQQLGVADAVLLMADIKASSRLEDNVDGPMSTYLYATSLMHCMTVSLALDGAGLGTAYDGRTIHPG